MTGVQGGLFAAGSPHPAPSDGAWGTHGSSPHLGALVFSHVEGVGVFNGPKQKLQRPKHSGVSSTSGHCWPRGRFQMLGGGASASCAVTAKSSLSPRGVLREVLTPLSHQEDTGRAAPPQSHHRRETHSPSTPDCPPRGTNAWYRWSINTSSPPGRLQKISVPL